MNLCILVMYSSAQNRRTAATNRTANPTEEKKNETKPSNTDTKSDAEKETAATKSEYNGKPFLNPRSDAWKLSTVVEFGGYPSDADITIINVYGHLGLNFDIGRRFHIGPYFRHKILSTHEYQIMKYRDIDYDVSSFKEWGGGLCFGGYFPAGNVLLFNPELRVGYNEFTIQSPSFNDSTKNFIYRNYINFTPRLNLGFKLSDYTIFNLHGGYTLPYFLNNPENVPHFNPATFHYGLGIRFYLTK